MSRNRFEQLLTMFHTSDNESQANLNDRLHKISNVLNMLQSMFKEAYVPENHVCIDESNVPFRGRIHFRVAGGYTWSFKVYTGKVKHNDTSVSATVVTELMDGLLNLGRTLH
uniref:PiggyBac transposable element-derived protein domain-containing protein n=1 Tax=Bactrocera latifrons TaxID=174628 RepID=A0A0K8UNP3_BACLA